MNEWVNKIALTPQSGVNCFILFKSIEEQIGRIGYPFLFVRWAILAWILSSINYGLLMHPVIRKNI